MTLPAELGLTAFVVALASGAGSFLSPCILPLLPAYLSFVSGVSVEQVEMADASSSAPLGWFSVSPSCSRPWAPASP